MGSFGDELKRLRDEKGMSQEYIATAVGVSQGAIGHLEKGRNLPSSDMLYKLCRALGVKCEYFEEYISPVDPEAATKLPPQPKRGRPKKADTPPQALAPPAKGEK